MTEYPAKYPTWGVLVEAPLERVRDILEPLRLHFDLRNFMVRTSGAWTAVFNMEPGDTSDNEAAELLRVQGLAPVFRFDFSKYEYLTSRWDGAEWHQDRDPSYVLGAHDIEIPGWERELFPTPKPNLAAVSRNVSIVEGANIDDVRDIVFDVHEALRIDQGPFGAIVYDPDVDTQLRLWEAPKRVFEIVFYPASRNFRFRIMKGDVCLGTFKPGESRTWDGTPFLGDVENETLPERIVEKLGVDRSFLDGAT